MEVIQAILTRRSIRKYSREKITDKQIEIILKAAMYAPSAMNQQPWHFIVIDNREKLNRIMEVHPHSNMLKEADLAILVCGDERLQLSKGYWVVDCGAATQNLLLAAHGIGLGAVWLGLHPREERKSGIRKIFHLPDHVQPFSLISIGYPAEEKPVPQRFKPERIHKNTW